MFGSINLRCGLIDIEIFTTGFVFGLTRIIPPDITGEMFLNSTYLFLLLGKIKTVKKKKKKKK